LLLTQKPCKTRLKIFHIKRVLQGFWVKSKWTLSMEASISVPKNDFWT